MDARFLKFDLPDVSETLRWGSAGYEDARRWPLLPLGTMTAGDPIPDLDERRLWVIPFCIITVPIPDFEDYLSREDEDEPSPEYDYLRDLTLALDLAEKPQKEKRIVSLREASLAQALRASFKQLSNSLLFRTKIAKVAIAWRQTVRRLRRWRRLLMVDRLARRFAKRVTSEPAAVDWRTPADFLRLQQVTADLRQHRQQHL